MLFLSVYICVHLWANIFRENVPQLSGSRPQVFGGEAQIAVEHQLHGGSSRQHYFGAARAEYAGQTSSGARGGTDARA